MSIPTTLQALAEPIDSLSPFDGNPRRGDLELLKSSLAHHGQYRPIVANRPGRVVLAGNHTLAAAQELGWEKIAVTWVDVDEDTARRIVAVDNRSNDAAGYDEQALADLLLGLPDLEGTGFADEDLAELVAGLDTRPAHTDPDEAPPLPAGEPVTKLGDVWLLGRHHRVMCGDATSESDVAVLLAGETVDAVWTDPPYGIAYVGGTKEKLTIVNDDLTATELGELLVAAFTRMRAVLKPGGGFYVCSPSGDLETTFRLALKEAGLLLRQQLVWVKDRFTLSRSDYQHRHETILTGWAEGADPEPVPLYDDAHGVVLYGWSEGAAHEWHGGRKQDTVWECARPTASRLHPTMKPVDLVRRAVENSTRAGGLVLDLFGGSGSTLLAAYGAGRRSASMELDPAYVDVICRRWQDHTGVAPVREATGEPFDFTLAT